MIIEGVKYSCAPCLRGHRSAHCPHADRPLTEVKKKGRPPLQCPTCKERKRKGGAHSKCQCPGYGGSSEGAKEKLEKKKKSRKPASSKDDAAASTAKGISPTSDVAGEDMCFEQILSQTIAEMPSPIQRAVLSIGPLPASFTAHDSSPSEHELELEETRFPSFPSSVSGSSSELLPYPRPPGSTLPISTPMIVANTQRMFRLPPLDPESKVTTWMDDLSTLSAALPFAPTYDLTDFAAGDTITCYNNCMPNGVGLEEEEEGRDVRSMAFWASMGGGASGNGSMLELPTISSSSDEWESCDESSASGYASTSVSESEYSAWDRMAWPGSRPGEARASANTSASASASGSECGWPRPPQPVNDWRY